MKIYSMIEALSHDPSLRFVGDKDVKEVFAKVNPFCIGYLNSVNIFCLLEMWENDLMADWKAVRQPVDFMTAVNSGKKFRPVGYSEFKNSEVWSWGGLTRDRVNGKWEIE